MLKIQNAKQVARRCPATIPVLSMSFLVVSFILLVGCLQYDLHSPVRVEQLEDH